MIHESKYMEAVEAYTKTLKMIKDKRDSRIALSSDDFLVEEKVYVNLGFAYKNLHMYEEAISSELTALDINPHQSWAHFNIGRTLC